MKRKDDKDSITLGLEDLIEEAKKDYETDEENTPDLDIQSDEQNSSMLNNDFSDDGFANDNPPDDIPYEDNESGNKEDTDSSENREDDFSHDEKVRKRAIKAICVLFVLLILCVIGLVIQIKRDSAKPIQWSSSIVEYGDKNFKPIKNLNGKTLVSVENLNTDVVGEYTIEAKVKDKDGKITKEHKKFVVKDTQKPTITTAENELTIKLGETPDYSLLQIKAKDPVDGAVSYVIEDGGLSSIGDHKISIKATDSNGNDTLKNITIHVTGYVTNDGLETYRQNVEKLKTAYEEAQKAKEEAEKAAKAEKTSTGRVIWVGDSRFVGMSQVCNNDNDVYVAKGSMGYSWFANTAVNEVNSQLKDGDTIIVNIGVNGLEYEKLAAKLNDLASGDWKDYKVIYMSVNPVDESKEVENGYSTTNAQIKEFNTYMKQHLGSNITYLDTYSSLVDSISSRTADGVHYSSNTSNAIYNMGRAALSQ